MDEKHFKKCSPSLVIREAQIQMTLRFYLTQVRMMKISTSGTHGEEDVGKGSSPPLLVRVVPMLVRMQGKGKNPPLLVGVVQPLWIPVPQEAEIYLKIHLYHSLDGHMPNGLTFNIYSRGLGLYPGGK